MAGGIFRERRGGNKGLPAGSNILLDVAGRPDQENLILYMPARNKGISQPDAEERMHVGRLAQVKLLLVDQLVGNGNPMARRRAGFAGTIRPEERNGLLFGRQRLRSVIYPAGLRVKGRGRVSGRSEERRVGKEGRS